MASPFSDSAQPRVAVVTVSYGSASVLTGFLESIPVASSHPLFTVVADNKGDGPGNVRDLTTSHNASYLSLPSNLGYGGAVNAAMETVPDSVDWLLVSNPDVVLSPGSIDELVSAAESDAAIGSVGPLIRTAEGTVYPSARAVPSLRTGVGHALFVNLWGENPWTRAYRRDTSAPEEQRDAGWLSGACLLVRRTAFEELGGFDEAFFMYFEDVDLGYRLGRSGWQNRYVPSAVVTHTGAHSTSTESGRMIEAHHHSAYRYLSRKYRGWYLAPLRWSLGIGLRARAWWLTRAGH